MSNAPIPMTGKIGPWSSTPPREPAKPAKRVTPVMQAILAMQPWPHSEDTAIPTKPAHRKTSLEADAPTIKLGARQRTLPPKAIERPSTRQAPQDSWLSAIREGVIESLNTFRSKKKGDPAPTLPSQSLAMLIGASPPGTNPTIPAEEIEREIEKIYAVAEHSPRFVAEELNRILNSLGKAEDLGRARLRMVLRSVSEIPLGDMPDWLAPQLDALSDVDDSPRPDDDLVEVTARLVRASLEATRLPGGSTASRSTVNAEISSYMGGRIEVAWNTRTPLRWIVDTASMPWPGVNVRSYTAPPGSHLLQCTRFHFAGSLAKNAAAILNGGNVE